MTTLQVSGQTDELVGLLRKLAVLRDHQCAFDGLSACLPMYWNSRRAFFGQRAMEVGRRPASGQLIETSDLHL